MARYGKDFKARAVARLLPPESGEIAQLSRELGVSVQTLQRWRAGALPAPARERLWTAAARLQALITTAAMDEAQRKEWCHEQGITPSDLDSWQELASAALAQPEAGRATRQQTQDRQRIKELECELRRRNQELAETAALLALMDAIFQHNEEGLVRRARVHG